MLELVEKILSQKVLGYNEDFMKTYFEYRIKIKDSDVVRVCYSMDTRIKGGEILTGDLTKFRPYVTRPIKDFR